MAKEADTYIGLRNGYRIHGTSSGWQVEEYVEATEKVEAHWTPFAHMNTLVGAIRFYLDHRMRRCGARCPADLEKLLREEAEIINSIDKLRICVEALGILG